MNLIYEVFWEELLNKVLICAAISQPLVLTTQISGYFSVLRR